MRNVAVRRSQQSPMLGQRASSHTVCSAWVRTIPTSSRKLGPVGSLTLSHSGRRSTLMSKLGGVTRRGESLQLCLDVVQESHGHCAVEGAVIEGETEVHDLTDRDPLPHHHGS